VSSQNRFALSCAIVVPFENKTLPLVSAGSDTKEAVEAYEAVPNKDPVIP